jgi:hypothetical protein
MYVQTFESYLKGGRQPLYHFTRRVFNIIESDMLRLGMSIFDTDGNHASSNNFKKSVSLTRSPMLKNSPKI